MRLRHDDGTVVHLAYNAGVHPAEDLENLIAHLTRYAVPVRRKLRRRPPGHRPLAGPLGRRQPRSPTASSWSGLRRSLEERGLEVVSLNGTGGRHQEVPGPDWAKPERYRYTMALAKILGLPAARRRAVRFDLHHPDRLAPRLAGRPPRHRLAAAGAPVARTARDLQRDRQAHPRRLRAVARLRARNDGTGARAGVRHRLRAPGGVPGRVPFDLWRRGGGRKGPAWARAQAGAPCRQTGARPQQHGRNPQHAQRAAVGRGPQERPHRGRGPRVVRPEDQGPGGPGGPPRRRPRLDAAEPDGVGPRSSPA